MRHTHHSRRRARQRAISQRHLEAVLEYGHARSTHGDTAYLLDDRALRGTPFERELERLRGLTVIVTAQGSIRTVLWDTRVRGRRPRRERSRGIPEELAS